MAQIVTYRGQKWYPYLNNEKNDDLALINHVDFDQTKPIIICINSANQMDTSNPIRRFSSFPTYLDLYDYIRDYPRERRCFFEVIHGQRPQKPHFDLEFDLLPGEDESTAFM